MTVAILQFIITNELLKNKIHNVKNVLIYVVIRF